MATTPLASAGQLDFTHRADPAALPELMDQPCPYEQLRDCLRDLASVNRWTLAYGPTLQFLNQAVSARSKTLEPLRILDVGSGGGDMLRRIALWAGQRRIPVELTGIDLNPHATRAAEEFSMGDPRFAEIRWRTGDAYTHAQAEDPDLILSSLVTHHMRDPEIVQFLRWSERTARQGWFVSDLVRSGKSYRLFRLLAKLMRWHPFVQHDGPVSIRRAFRRDDWNRLFTAAEIPLNVVHLAHSAPGRLCLTRLRKARSPTLPQ